MVAVNQFRVSIYVDRASQQWIVRDPDGKFWIVPTVENAWEHRRPFEPAEDMDLLPIPGHYKYLLRLPF